MCLTRTPLIESLISCSRLPRTSTASSSSPTFNASRTHLRPELSSSLASRNKRLSPTSVQSPPSPNAATRGLHARILASGVWPLTPYRAQAIAVLLRTLCHSEALLVPCMKALPVHVDPPKLMDNPGSRRLFDQRNSFDKGRFSKALKGPSLKGSRSRLKT